MDKSRRHLVEGRHDGGALLGVGEPEGVAQLVHHGLQWVMQVDGQVTWYMSVPVCELSFQFSASSMCTSPPYTGKYAWARVPPRPSNAFPSPCSALGAGAGAGDSSSLGPADLYVNLVVTIEVELPKPYILNLVLPQLERGSDGPQLLGVVAMVDMVDMMDMVTMD